VDYGGIGGVDDDEGPDDGGEVEGCLEHALEDAVPSYTVTAALMLIDQHGWVYQDV
jgi:hypothetical protein